MNRARWCSMSVAALVVAGCSGGAADAPSDGVASSVGEGEAALTTAAPTYRWPVPAQGWFTDQYAFPLPFAPQLPYAGVEELHQLEGFGTPDSPQFWSYDYLFWLAGAPTITRETLERDLRSYYQGLCDFFGPPAVTCDPAAFRSEVVELDGAFVGGRRAKLFAADVDFVEPFFTGKPITLHMGIASFECPRAKHRAVLVAASPTPVGAGPWPELLANAAAFRCE